MKVPTVLFSPMKFKFRIDASLFVEDVLKLLIVVRVVSYLGVHILLACNWRGE